MSTMKLLLTILISLPLLTNSIHLRSHLHPMTPEFTKQITILNATEQKVRDKIKTIEGDLTLKKDHLKTLEQQVRDQITTNNQIQHWLSKAQISISTIEKAKESVQIKYDLQRLKPFVALAEKRKDNLFKQSEKAGSAHKEVSDRVESLEAQLRELQLEVKTTPKTITTTTSTSSGPAETAESSTTKSEIDTAEGSLDDLLKELE